MPATRVSARECFHARPGARVRVCVRVRNDAIPPFFRPAARRPSARPRRLAPVWQRRGRHRFRSATATARSPPGRHDTKAVLAVQRFLRSDAQAAADTTALGGRQRTAAVPLPISIAFAYRRLTGGHRGLGGENGGAPASTDVFFQIRVLLEELEPLPETR